MSPLQPCAQFFGGSYNPALRKRGGDTTLGFLTPIEKRGLTNDQPHIGEYIEYSIEAGGSLEGRPAPEGKKDPQAQTPSSASSWF